MNPRAHFKLCLRVMARPLLAPRSGFAYHPLDPRQARGRLLITTTAMFGVTFALARQFGWVLRSLAAFDVGVLTLLIFDAIIIFGSSVSETRRRAAAQDPGRRLLLVLVLLSATVGLFAAAFVLRRAQTLAPESPGSAYALSLIAVVGAWLLTNASFTLRYAHLYFRDDGTGEGGLEFPGTESPDAVDFAYFAFTVGMCFQVSDVAVSSRAMRRAVLIQSLLCFAYNTVILGMALNLFFGILG